MPQISTFRHWFGEKDVSVFLFSHHGMVFEMDCLHTQWFTPINTVTDDSKIFRYQLGFAQWWVTYFLSCWVAAQQYIVWPILTDRLNMTQYSSWNDAIFRNIDSNLRVFFFCNVIQCLCCQSSLSLSSVTSQWCTISAVLHYCAILWLTHP